MLISSGTVVSSGLGAAAVLAALAGGCAYAAMVPSSEIFGKALIAPALPQELALTFDDGPNPAWTPQLVDVLAKHKVKATFFFVGKFALAEPALTRYVADAGHVIGNHSWSHPNLALTAPGKVKEELQRTKETLEQVLSKAVRYFRPPFGARRPDVLSAARRLGMTPVLWNAMTSDWSEPSADQIFADLCHKIDGANGRGFGANIVLHDGSHLGPGANRRPSVSAADKILERYGPSHRFVTLESWQ